MSLWTDIRDPFFGMAAGGPVGAGLALGADAAGGNGFFEPGPQFGVDWSSMPKYPGYTPGYNPSTMSVEGISPDERGLDAYRQEALRTGPSAWADMATAKSYGDEARSRDVLTAGNASGTATARDNLAMRGGLRSGAAERVETAGNNSLMAGSQKLASEGTANRQQIGINDEQNRISQLGALPGMENADTQIKLAKKEFDVGQETAETGRQNQYNMGLYEQNASNWRAGQEANAQVTANKGSWVCTESRKLAKPSTPEWDEKEAKLLLSLKRFAMKEHGPGARFYLYKCNELIKRMHAAGDVDWKDIYREVQLALFRIEKGGMKKAYRGYVRFIVRLLDKYWPECDNPVYCKVKGRAA